MEIHSSLCHPVCVFCTLTHSLSLPPPHPTQAAVKMEVVAQKKIRVAINGFGRIGRNFLRCWEGRKDSLLEVVAVNDSGGVKQACHLLKYDTTLGKFSADVKAVDDKTISMNGKNITVVSSRDPTQLPWKAMDIDLVIEGTGVFIDTPGAGKHIQVSCGVGSAGGEQDPGREADCVFQHGQDICISLFAFALPLSTHTHAPPIRPPHQQQHEHNCMQAYGQ